MMGTDKLYYVAKFLPNQIIVRRFQDFNITVANKTTIDPRARFTIMDEGDGDNKGGNGDNEADEDYDGSGGIEVSQNNADGIHVIVTSTLFPDYVQEHFQMTYNKK